MAVPCSGCGREYDVSLFAFGRTIHCTCGARVGVEPRVRALDAAAGDAAPRFVADAMLGRLARWLRLLGFDCVYDAEAGDDEVVRRALDEGRILLTRDRSLPEEWWIQDVCVLRAERPDDQLVEVVERLGLRDRLRPLTRCSECNGPLRPLPRESARGRVPEGVLAREERFWECADCGHVYWQGSHADRIREVVARLASDATSASSSDPD